MSYIGKNPKLDALRYSPLSSDPSNSVEGMVFRSDGTSRAKGLWEYINGSWTPLGSGLGDSDTIALYRAHTNAVADFMTIKSIDDLLPDFSATDTLAAGFSVPTSGENALLSKLDDHSVFEWASASGSQYDAQGFNVEIPKAIAGRDIVIKEFYRTKDDSSASAINSMKKYIRDASNSVKYTANGIEAAAQTVLSVNENPQALSTFTFVDGDVTTADDTVTETSHGMFTGQRIQLTTSGTLPAGLSTSTDYYIIKVDVNTVKFASSESNAYAGTAVDITAAAGGGTHTVSRWQKLYERIQISCDSDVLETHITAISSTTITVADALVSQWSSGKHAHTGILTDSLNTYDSADSNGAKNGSTFSNNILIPKGCESIDIVYQQLTSQTDFTFWVDNILISSDPFKRIGTQGITEEVNGTSDLSSPADNTISLTGTYSAGTFTATQKCHVIATIDGTSPTINSISQTSFNEILNSGDTLVLGGTPVGYSITATPMQNESIIVESVNSVITEWTSFTPTAGSGFGTITDAQGKWRRVGDSMEIDCKFALGTPTTGTIHLDMPSGYIIDSNKLNGDSDNMLGFFVATATTNYFNGSVSGYSGICTYDGTNTDRILMAVRADANNSFDITENVNSFFLSGDGIHIRCTVPISGWDSNSKPLLSFPTITYGQEPEEVQGTTNLSSPSINTTSSLGSYSAGTFTSTIRCKVTATIDGTSPTIDAVSRTSKTVILNPADTLVLGGTPTSYSLVVEPIQGVTNQAAIISQPVAFIKDEKAASTDGGTFTSGAWQTRDLNTLSGDIAAVGVTLSSNQFTLPVGKYVIEAQAPGFYCQLHKAKLYNTTDSLDAIIGSSELTATTTSESLTYSFVKGVLTLTKSTTFELQHQCSITRATDGFGQNSNFSVVEVYSQIKITRMK